MVTKLAEYSETVDLPAGEIWAIIASFGSEKLWMPDCIKSSLQGFGVGCVRTLVFGSTPDVVITERMESIDPAKHTLRFRVFRSDLPHMENYGTVILEAVGERRTIFTWIGESDLDDESQRHALEEKINAMYAGFIESIVTKLS